jgi:4'-phosphopantetheinyl transferase
MTLWQMETSPDCLWLPPTHHLRLSNDEVHVWRVSLDLPAPHVQSLQQTLAPDELDRTERFHFQIHRQRFIVTRGLLRVILGRYLNIEPNQLHFSYSDYGKPALIPPPAQEALNFNVSHSHELALYAITRNRHIGIDVEYVHPISEIERIAERFFSAQENAVLRTLPQTEKLNAFFKCWTRKEAYIKAKGEGLSAPLDQFDVSLAPGEPARLLNVRGDPQEVSRWSLQELIPGPGYVAALAVEGHDWGLSLWQWRFPP